MSTEPDYLSTEYIEQKFMETLMAGKEIDIATEILGQKVDASVNTSYYKNLLQAIQKKARELGCLFIKGTVSDDMPPEVKQCLAEALVLQRDELLYPKDAPDLRDKTVSYEQLSGFAEKWLEDILSALTAEGIVFKLGDYDFMSVIRGVIAAMDTPGEDGRNMIKAVAAVYLEYEEDLVIMRQLSEAHFLLALSLITYKNGQDYCHHTKLSELFSAAYARLDDAGLEVSLEPVADTTPIAPYEDPNPAPPASCFEDQKNMIQEFIVDTTRQELDKAREEIDVLVSNTVAEAMRKKERPAFSLSRLFRNS